MRTLAKAAEWGNSVAVRTPKNVTEECGIEADSPVEIAREGNLIIGNDVSGQQASLKLSGMCP